MFEKKYLGAAIAACTLTLGVVAQADDREIESLRGENFSLEEVIVTARKKVENLQAVPIAIDAFSAEMLDEKAINTLEDVARYSSSLTFEQGVLPNDTRPVIRGVNINRGRPNVGILVDGIDISSETLTVAGGGAFANLSLLDLERIEVVKGPQSVIYGRSAFAGAVNYVTKRPVADQGLYGYTEAEYDEHGYLKLLGNVAFPITDHLAMGITAVTSDFDGYYENPNTGGDLGAVDQEGVAFSLNYEGSGDFTAYFRAEYADESYTPRAVASRSSVSQLSAPDDFFLLGTISDFGKNMAIPGGDRGRPESAQADCDVAKSFSHYVGIPPVCASMLVGNQGKASESDIDQSPNPQTGKDFNGTEVENLRLTLELDWQIGDVQVLSLTGYTDNDTSVEEDFDLTNFDLESRGPGTAKFDPFYLFADPFGDPADFTPLNNNPDAAMTQFGVNTNSDTSFEYDQISQEFRFLGVAGDLEWMADILYWEENMDAVMNQMWWARETTDEDYWNSQLSRVSDPTCTLPGKVDTCMFFTGMQTEMTPNPIPMTRDTEHWSVAASLVYNFSDNLRGTLEGRYLEETIDYTGLPIDTFIHGFLNMPYFDPLTNSTVPQVQKESVEETEFVPRVSVDWQVTEDVFTYASAGKGFKPGGIATTDGNGDISTGHYKPEELWAYEIGVKTDLLGNRLRLNGAVFYNDYTNQQVPFFITNMLGVTNVSVTNAGESEILGMELEATYRPSANWTFFMGYTHVEAEYQDFNISDVGVPGTYDRVLSGNAEGDFSGKAFTNTPEDVVVASIRYDGQFDGGVNYFTELFSNYQSKRYLDQGNLSWLPSTTLVDFSAGISSESWQVTAYVNNLTDEDDVQSGLGNVSYGFMPVGQIPPFGANLSLPNPRTFGIRARYNF
jgi:iron complex outermembrane recepter protein